jgi:hypothetical protein
MAEQSPGCGDVMKALQAQPKRLNAWLVITFAAEPAPKPPSLTTEKFYLTNSK